MSKRLHKTTVKKNKDIINVEFDITKVPNPDRKFSRLKNKAQVFEDRRFKKPKYKKDYQED